MADAERPNASSEYLPPIVAALIDAVNRQQNHAELLLAFAQMVHTMELCEDTTTRQRLSQNPNLTLALAGVKDGELTQDAIYLAESVLADPDVPAAAKSTVRTILAELRMRSRPGAAHGRLWDKWVVQERALHEAFIGCPGSKRVITKTRSNPSSGPTRGPGRPRKAVSKPAEFAADLKLLNDWRASKLTQREFLLRRGIGHDEGVQAIDRARKHQERAAGDHSGNNPCG